jgi:ferrochelatase
MAYGSPSDEADIERYYTHIRGGRPPSAEALAELTERYAAAGGSPLTAVARAAGIERLIGLPLAPHYAEMSLGAYERTLASAWDGELLFVRGFHDHPAFIQSVVNLLSQSLAQGMPDRIFFTAHSLPTRIVAEGDPYPDRLLESCRLVEAQIELPRWEFAFQSASTTGEPWLGPDLLVAIERSDARNALVCPIGFVADHLEILYDLDIEAQRFARKRDIRLRRTASFNTRPDFIEALADVVRDAIASGARPAEKVES